MKLDLSGFDLSDCTNFQILEINGALYSLRITELLTCAHCGGALHETDYFTHAARIYKDNNYHLCCLREMYKKSNHETMDEKGRVEKILKRMSRNRILTPREIGIFCSTIAPRLRKRPDSVKPNKFWLGMYKGAAVLPDDLEQYEAMEFWGTVEKKAKKEGDIELAVLLLLSGDKNAVNHATSRSSGNLWRGKAVDSGNHRKH